jgi:hypothetical protein
MEVSTYIIGPGITLLLTIILGFVSLLMTMVRIRYVVVLLVFLMPFQNIVYQSFVSFDLYKVVTLGFVFGFFLRAAIDPTILKKLYMNKWLIAFLIIVVISGLLNYSYLKELDTSSFSESFFRGPTGRSIVQLFSLLLRIAMFQMAIVCIDSLSVLKTVIKWMLISITILSFHGVSQLIGYHLGFPIMGLMRSTLEASGEIATFSIGGTLFYRITSLAGEPKMLAQFLLPMILLIFIAQRQKINFGYLLTSKGILVMHVSIFLLCYATSSWLAFVIALPFIMYVWRGDKIKVSVWGFLKIIVIFGLVAGIIWGSAITEVFTSRFMKRIPIDRTIGYDTGIIHELDVLEFLQKHPSFIPFGMGIGNLCFYTSTHVSPLNSGTLREIAEFGLVGFLFFVIFIVSILRKSLFIIRHNKNKIVNNYSQISLALVITSMAMDLFYSTELNGQLWFYLGINMAINKLASVSKMDHVN